ncbi:MAG TPA: methyltransferase domain-containing protein [Candidatus Acidoferrales bacterium]|nr:methyltransferase domain-containing protein [Candidatus Acidoferrales bacterium]
MSEPYTKGFFADIRAGSVRSAEEIVPLVLGLVPARSVVDVGCGDGSWLSVFRRNGVLDVLGIDGDYVQRDTLQIPPEQFQAADLSKPVQAGRKFDLAVSLEVAEHLPPESAATFVESLTQLAPVVLFSAAIPLQGGMHHVNEQWPDKWAGLFQEHGYRLVDCIRKRVWQNEAVEYWYAQNALLFVRSDVLEGNKSLALEFERTNLNQLRLVHPRKYLELASPHRTAPGLRAASRIWLATLKQSIEWRLRPFRSTHSARNGGRQCPPQNR